MGMSSNTLKTAKKQADVVIGERVHTLMWRSGRTQRELGAVLGVDQGSVSNRLHGKTAWTAFDLVAVAEWLSVPVTDLLPPPPSNPVAPIRQTPTDGGIFSHPDKPVVLSRKQRRQPVPIVSGVQAA